MGNPPDRGVACDGRGRFGDGDYFATSFIKLEFRCSPNGSPGEPALTPYALLVPGCAALEDLAGTSRQSAGEIYNEIRRPFDYPRLRRIHFGRRARGFRALCSTLANQAFAVVVLYFSA